MITDVYVSRSRVMRSLRAGPLGEHIHLYVAQLQQGGYSLETGHRRLSIVRDFGFWLGATGAGLADIDEATVTQYLAERSRHRPPFGGEADTLIPAAHGAALAAASGHARLDIIPAEGHELAYTAISQDRTLAWLASIANQRSIFDTIASPNNK